MVQITQSGALNTAALVVPDLYVQITSPQALSLNGVPSDLLGIVGTASWGPVDQPVLFGSLAGYNAAFGAVLVRGFDMGTPASCAIDQGASALVGVRVTDGTDTAANYAVLYSAVAGNYPLLLTAICTGSRGNQIAIVLAGGTSANSWKLTLQVPGMLPEVFDNIAGGGGPANLWSNMVLAVNVGTGPMRGPSQLCLATLGAGTAIAPAMIGNQSLMGGTDGVTGIASAALVGMDGLSRTGMFALRGQGCAVALLADCTDPTAWSAMSAFGLQEGIYMIACGASGDSIVSAIESKQSFGIDSYALKMMFGDWLYWYDSDNSQTRMVSPLGFVAGCLVNLSPEQSGLNKQLSGIIGSQKSGLSSSGQTTTYSSVELQALFSAGIDVICNPAPGGAYWAIRCGHNSSTNFVIASDAYTRMTNFIAQTLAAGMGRYVGSVINSTLLSNVRATLLGFLSNLVGQGILGSVDGSIPYAVVCGTTNNPAARTSLGYVQADVQIQYQGINEKFIVNLQGGQGVTITSSQTPSIR
ncbi:phage tail protein [Lichenicoccus roseus]|uniref:Phage tail protein n=1 Tax=Lichenicoccus roseus TaxID=2683649 RepID=A0A5R9J760_9PROT|nr:phage tail protein [Lichenicoccus roseus]TLU72683.1 phage tail protein [Lichenicoccus roseus]